METGKYVLYKENIANAGLTRSLPSQDSYHPFNFYKWKYVLTCVFINILLLKDLVLYHIKFDILERTNLWWHLRDSKLMYELCKRSWLLGIWWGFEVLLNVYFLLYLSEFTIELLKHLLVTKALLKLLKLTENWNMGLIPSVYCCMTWI